jgi:hypothetical protein
MCERGVRRETGGAATEAGSKAIPRWQTVQPVRVDDESGASSVHPSAQA